MKAFGRNLRTSKSKKYHCKIVRLNELFLSPKEFPLALPEAGSPSSLMMQFVRSWASDALRPSASAIAPPEICSSWKFVAKIADPPWIFCLQWWQRSLLIAAWRFPFLGLSCWRWWVHNHHGRCQKLQLVWILFLFCVVVLLCLWLWFWLYYQREDGFIKKQFWVGMQYVVGVLWHVSKFHLRLRTVVILIRRIAI